MGASVMSVVLLLSKDFTKLILIAFVLAVPLSWYLMNNWLTAGIPIDAVAANNDEMAIGAIMAIRQAGIAPGKILVGGVDATPDALAEVEKGALAVTVFQDARGQGRGALDAAVKLSRGEKVDSFVWIPFELVTRENYKSFLDR